MKTAIVITPHVINTINSLPENERIAIANALIRDMILESEKVVDLTPMQTVIYAIIKQYVSRDTDRFVRTGKMLSDIVTTAGM